VGSLASRINTNQEEMRAMLDACLKKNWGKSRRTAVHSDAAGSP
jgi:hypothetical protein